MKISWQWFKEQGDGVFVLAAILCLVLQGDPSFPKQYLHWVMDVSLFCALAHQRFFPNAPALPSAPANKE